MAIPQIMLQRLQTMGAKILSQSDDAIRFITKNGDDISMQWGKRNIFGEMEDFVTSWTKTNKKTGTNASMNRRLSREIDSDDFYDLKIVTDTKHINKPKGIDYETKAVHKFWAEEDPNSLKSFRYNVTDYNSDFAHTAVGTSFVTKNNDPMLAYTVAKGNYDDVRVDSIRQGIQKINYLY